MKTTNLKKLTLTAIFAALAVIGSLFSVPVFGAKCMPVQHLINIFCAIFLGPWYGLTCAFITSLIRNFIGTGTLLAFPGSMCGAFISGMLYKYGKRRWLAYIGEVFGTSVIGGLLAFPVAYFILENAQATIFMYIIPFLISTAVGSMVAAILCEIMAKSGLLVTLKGQLEEETNEGTNLYNTDGCR